MYLMPMRFTIEQLVVKDTFVAKIMLQVVVSCFFVVFFSTPRETIQYLTSIFFRISRHHQLEIGRR